MKRHMPLVYWDTRHWNDAVEVIEFVGNVLLLGAALVGMYGFLFVLAAIVGVR